MLRLIIQLFGAELKAEVRARTDRAIQLMVFGLAAGIIAVIGLVFLLVGLTFALAPVLGAAGAAAAVGAGTLFVALVVLAAAGSQPRRRARALSAAAAPPPYPAADPAPPFGTTPFGATPSAPGRPPAASTVAAAGLAAILAGVILGRRL